MNDEFLIDCLYWSARLAGYQEMFTPELDLSWNPRDEASLCKATEAFLEHVGAHYFPVYDFVDEVGHASYLLSQIPVVVQGFDAWDGDGDLEDYKDGSLMRLLVAMLWLFVWGLNFNRDADKDLIEEIARYRIDQPAPPWELFGWLEQKAETEPDSFLPEGWEHWRGFSLLLRILTMNTGYDWFDRTTEEMDSAGGSGLKWGKEEFEDLKQEWAIMEGVLNTANAFLDWANAGEANLERTLAMMRQSLAEMHAAKATATWKLNWDALGAGRVADWVAVQELLQEAEDAGHAPE